MKTFLITAAIWTCALGDAGAQTVDTAGPPPLIPFSGTLTDATGAPLVDPGAAEPVPLPRRAASASS